MTQFPPYYWSHVISDNPVDLFENGMSDFLEKLTLIHTKRFDSARHQRIAVARMRRFSATHFSQIGVARAMAYAISVYANKIDWNPTLDEEFEHVPSELLSNPSLPIKFRERLQEKDAVL